MTQPATRIFLLLLLVLTGGLIALWFNADGSLRNTVWTPPQAVVPELAFKDPLPASAQAVDVNLFVATLERPLFSPSRRPPPPPPPKEEKKEPPVDPFAKIHLFGLYGGEDSPSGMLARVDGKVKRISINDNLDGWKFKAIDDRNAIFEKDGEERKLLLAITKPEPPKPMAKAGAPAAGNAGEAPPPPASQAEAVERRRLEFEERQRERLKRRNAARVKAGAEPIEMQ